MLHRIMQFGAAALLLGAVSNGAVLAQERLVLAEQGSFSVGGRVVTAPGTFDPTIPGAGARNDGQSFWIDQLYAQYQVPVNARRLPIVMIHGGAGTGRVWETTPDGREGFQTIFVRRGFPVYVVDVPRRGRARIPSFIGPLGVLSGTQIIPPTTFAVGTHQAFLSWRLGPEYPNFFPNSQFPKARGPEAVPPVDRPDLLGRRHHHHRCHRRAAGPDRPGDPVHALAIGSLGLGRGVRSPTSKASSPSRAATSSPRMRFRLRCRIATGTRSPRATRTAATSGS